MLKTPQMLCHQMQPLSNVSSFPFHQPARCQPILGNWNSLCDSNRPNGTSAGSETSSQTNHFNTLTQTLWSQNRVLQSEISIRRSPGIAEYITIHTLVCYY